MIKPLRLKGNPTSTTAPAARPALITDHLPPVVAHICETMVKTQFFNRDYVMASALAAASAAIGNALSVQLLPGWTTNASLFTMIIGRAGSGKTPPMKAAFRPIYEHDRAQVEQYTALPKEKRMSARLTQTVVNDFTPEALTRAHQSNPRGIVVAVDEIMGMFNSANRYNASPLIEQILSAFSGAPLKINRVSDPEPIVINNPCISIIGTAQTKRLNEFLKDEYFNNGLIDRFLFVCPSENDTPAWDLDIIQRYGQQIQDNIRHWDMVLERLISLPYDPGEPVVVRMSDDATNLFCNWRNVIVAERDLAAGEDTRPDKRPLLLGKIALIIHALAWATSHTKSLGEISLSEMTAALRISDWYEDNLVRARAASIRSRTRGQASMADMMDLLDDDFTSKDLYAGADMLGMSKSEAYRQLNRMIDNGLIRRISNGNYEKAIRTSSADKAILTA